MVSGSSTFVPVMAANSLATPKIDKQSGRLGVTSASRIASPRNEDNGCPASAESSKTKMPAWSSPSPSSLSEQTIPDDSIPLIVAAFKDSSFPVLLLIIKAPSFAKAIFCPGVTLGAPQTTVTISSFPRFTLGSRSLSAFG